MLVEVGQTIRVDLTLQPGAQTQTITVSEEPRIDTTDATLGGTVSNAGNPCAAFEWPELRAPAAFAPRRFQVGGHQPGGAWTRAPMAHARGLTSCWWKASLLRQHGGADADSVYRTGDANSLLPIDAIQEFNTEQNPKAEYGWRDGSVINVGVKSGTNSLHGAAYAFGRDAQAIDARNAFTPTAASTPATVEQFGAVGGGRISRTRSSGLWATKDCERR